MAKTSAIIVLSSLMFSCVHTESMNTTDEADSSTSSRLRQDEREYWTEWYDVDDPVSGDGDYETVQSITGALRRNICPSTHSITRADCAVDNGDVDDIVREDSLSLPCSTAGLACRNSDQTSGICNNYRIRFFCQPLKSVLAKGDTTQDEDEERKGSRRVPRFDMRIYIVLAAIPVVIFLFRICWSCTFDKRRRRNRRSTRARRPAQDEEAVHPEVFLPPPSYQELFGLNGGPFLLSRHYSLCRKCKSSQCGIFRDRHLTNRDTEVSNESLSTSSEHEQDVMITSATTSSSAASPSSSRSNSLTESSSSESSASTTITDPEAPNSHPTVQPAQCDCPCHKQAPEVSVYDNPTYEPEVEIHNGRSTRISGMHLPVLSLIRSTSASSVEEAPPPTYKEALKILKLNSKGTR
ncbi:mucin-5AC-like [Haliotis asinina]|uniref:mucin-5AC-like n=1 Tax=Haliotis asinina TaxID=109174 RepID=UPI0035322E47